MDLTARNPDGTPAPPRATVTARPSWAARMKLHEPVRLYGHALALVVAIANLALLAAGVRLPAAGDLLVGVIIGALVATTEGIRASVYSPATMVGLLLARHGQSTVPTPESESAR
jgi:hypothetical protein